MLSYKRAFDYSCAMKNEPSAIASWTLEEIAIGKRWVDKRHLANAGLERIRCKELREFDTYRAIELLFGPAGYSFPTRSQNRSPVWSNNSDGS